MEIPAAEVKALRDETGAGMMDCKRALQEAGGDLEGARAILRQSGKSKGAKREGKTAGEGGMAVAAATDASAAVAVELRCETDFVARSDDFRALCQTVADWTLQTAGSDFAALGLTDAVDEALTRLGEKLELGRQERYEAAPGGVVGHYLHTATNKVAVLLELGCEGDGDRTAVAGVGRDLAMQVAAMRPEVVSIDQIPADRLATEREVLRGSADMAGKPAEIQDRMIEGRLRKGFYQQICLLEQIFARDGEKTVTQWLAEQSRQLGVKLSVRRFTRLEVGG